MDATPRGTLAVVGGGVIGLSVARRAAQDGWAVRVHRAPATGASWVAGGMLAPHSEAWPGEERLLHLGLASLQLWRGGFLDGLPADVVTARESLVVAVDRADAADLRTVADWLAAQGHPVEVTTAARDIEPLLAQGIRHGLRADTELAVDNRAVVAALADHCARLGVVWAPPVEDLAETADADVAVIANGIDAPTLWPGLPVRPVKGEVLRLRWRRGCMPVPQRVIRARVHGRQVYLVPRGDGLVVGATQYEHGRDTAPSVAGVRELLDDACEVMPALGEYELAESAAGLRPMTGDNLPLVGRLDDRTLVAAGHGRSGFLLAPWTAEAVAAELRGAPLPEAAGLAAGLTGAPAKAPALEGAVGR
jgi:glycine oxidase